MEGDMLFGDQSRANPSPQVLVEEACDVCGTNIFSAFQKSSCKYGYSIGVSLNQIGHHLGKLDFIF